MRSIFVIFIFVLFLSSCENEYQSEQNSDLEDQIVDLECEAGGIEEDFYFAYKALVQTDSFLNSNDIDNARRIVKTVLTDLGGTRFYLQGRTALDMLTLRHVSLDSITLISREMRYMDYPVKRDSFVKIVESDKGNNAIL